MKKEKKKDHVRRRGCASSDFELARVRGGVPAPPVADRAEDPRAKGTFCSGCSARPRSAEEVNGAAVPPWWPGGPEAGPSRGLRGGAGGTEEGLATAAVHRRTADPRPPAREKRDRPRATRRGAFTGGAVSLFMLFLPGTRRVSITMVRLHAVLARKTSPGLGQNLRPTLTVTSVLECRSWAGAARRTLQLSTPCVCVVTHYSRPHQDLIIHLIYN